MRISFNCTPCAPDIFLVLVHIVNFYLEENNKAHCHHIQELARSNSSSAFETLARYAREALRLDPVTVGITREVGSAMFVPGVAEPVNIHPGDKVFLSLKKANLDEVRTCFGIIASIDLKKHFIQPKSRTARRHPNIEDSHHYEVFLGDGVVRLLGENFILTVGILYFIQMPCISQVIRPPRPYSRLYSA